MDDNEEPWDERWKIIDQLDPGAQGYTFKVERIEDGKLGVLKKLKHQHVKKARGRMHQEVVNLGILSDLSVHVPKVLEDGTAGFDNPKVTLYFVMEFIPGDTLEDTINKRGKLALDESIAVTRALAEIVAAAHEARILHRDLKPGNVMVRDFEKKDIVMVDLGLSFNEDESENLTETDETVGNKFLRLPESDVGGDDKRDKRSDVTLLVGVLYYCVTGHKPKVLRDHPNQLAPHQRPDRTAREALAGEPRLRSLEALLDRGFQFSAEERFQTCGDLIGRLNKLASAVQPFVEEPNEVAARLLAQLRATNRTTQIVELRQKVHAPLGMRMQTLTAKLNVPQFQLLWQGVVQRAELPPGCDTVLWQNSLMISLPTMHPGISSSISFVAGANGQECTLFRYMQSMNPPNVSRGVEWEVLTIFNPDNLPSEAELIPKIKDSINIAMAMLYEQIQAKRPGG